MLRERALFRFQIILHEGYNLVNNAFRPILEEALCEWLGVLPESLCVKEIKPTDSGQALAEVEISGNLSGVSLAETARLLHEKASFGAFNLGGPIRVAVQNVRIEMMTNTPNTPRGECAGPSPAGNLDLVVHREYVDDVLCRLNKKKEAVGRSYREWFPYKFFPYPAFEYKQLYAIVVALRLRENLPPSVATDSEEIAPAYSGFRLQASQQHKLSLQDVDQAVLEAVAREIIRQRVLELEADRGNGSLDEIQLATQIHDAINQTLSQEWVAETVQQVLDEMEMERQKSERSEVQKHMIRNFLENLKHDVAARQQEKAVLLDPKKFKFGPGGNRKTLDQEQMSQLWTAFVGPFLEPILEKQLIEISHAFLIVLFPEFSSLYKEEKSSLSSEIKPWKLFLECLLTPGSINATQEDRGKWRQTLELWDAFLRKFRSEFESVLMSEYRNKYLAFLKSWVLEFHLIPGYQCVYGGNVTLSTPKNQKLVDVPPRVEELDAMQAKLTRAIQRRNAILFQRKSDDKVSPRVQTKPCCSMCNGSVCGGSTIWTELVLTKKHMDSQMHQATTVLTEVLKEHLVVLQVETRFLLSLTGKVMFTDSPGFYLENFIDAMQKDLGRENAAVRNLLWMYISFLDHRLIDDLEGEKAAILLNIRWRKIRKKQNNEKEKKEKEQKEEAERIRRLKETPFRVQISLYEELRALVYPKGPIESENSLLKHLTGEIDTVGILWGLSPPVVLRSIAVFFKEIFGSVFDTSYLVPSQYRRFQSEMTEIFLRWNGKDRTRRGFGVDLIVQTYIAPVMICANFVARLAPRWAEGPRVKDQINMVAYSHFIADMHKKYRQLVGLSRAYIHKLLCSVFFDVLVFQSQRPTNKSKLPTCPPT